MVRHVVHGCQEGITFINDGNYGDHHLLLPPKPKYIVYYSTTH